MNFVKSLDQHLKDKKVNTDNRSIILFVIHTVQSND